jgi:thiopurine S-methyltransferase
MEHSFWHERWESGRIGFHQGKPNKLLLAHFHALGLADRSRVFLPLCGKTLDIGWLLSQGHRVAGAELSELAIVQLFEDLGVEPDVSRISGELKRYSADRHRHLRRRRIFNLTAELLGPVDAVFDRAALVALPKRCAAAYAPISSYLRRTRRSC